MNRHYTVGYKDAVQGCKCTPPDGIEADTTAYCEGYWDGFGLHTDGFKQPCGPNDTNGDYGYCEARI